MTQALLDSSSFKLLLQEGQLKQEIDDWCVCVCEYCQTPETVDVHDSNRNTSPFMCSCCYTIDAMEAYHNGLQMSAYTSETTTQSRSVC